MKIRLNGYFDKNFGDDVMQLVLVDNMKEDIFFADCPQREFLMHFAGRKNVYINCPPNDIDAYVNVIGTGFMYKSKMSILSKLIGLPREDKLKYGKTAAVGCSVEPPGGMTERLLIRRELNKYRYLSCRDDISESYMLKEARRSIVRVHEDIVFGIDEKYIYKNTGEDCLGIIPVQRCGSDNNFEYYKHLAQACDSFADKHGKKVLLFALDTGNENDTLAAMSVKKLMNHSGSAEIIAYNSEPEYIFKNIARCGRIVSSRFHGVVAALLAGVPVAAVSDRKKIDILSEKYGFEAIKKSALRENELSNMIERAVAPVTLPRGIANDARKHITELKEYLKG